MNKKELVSRVALRLRENDMKKSVSIKKHTFHISDDYGNTKDFMVKAEKKDVIYTIDDANAIIDACLEVIKDSLSKGEPVSISGFGTLFLNYRKERSTVHPITREPVVVKARYSPKLSFGSDLRMCAKLYELSLDELSSKAHLIIDEVELDDQDSESWVEE